MNIPAQPRLTLSLLTALWGSATLASLDIYQMPGLAPATHIGAGLAGLALAPLLSAPGLWRPALAVTLATLLGAALAGLGVSLAEGAFAGILLGPWFVALSVATNPATALVWLSGALALPLAAKALWADPRPKDQA